MPTKKDLQHAYDTTLGLWCIDRNPAEVDYDWIVLRLFRFNERRFAGHSQDLPFLHISTPLRARGKVGTKFEPSMVVEPEAATVKAVPNEWLRIRSGVESFASESPRLRSGN